MDFGRGFLGQKAHDDDRHEGEDKARHEFVNLEDFGREAGEVELPNKCRKATHEHTRNSSRECRTLPEESKQHNRAKRCTETAPSKAHEAHHHIKEALAVLHAVGTRSALHCDNHSDKRNHHDHATAHPHHFLVACVLAEQVLVKVVTECGCGHQKLGVSSTHDSSENGGHKDGCNRRMAKSLAENHENAFRVINGDAISRHVIAAEECNHHNCGKADNHPSHSNTARILDFFGVLDGHEAHEDVRHAKVAKAP